MKSCPGSVRSSSEILEFICPTVTLIQPREARFRAFVGDGQEALDALGADDVGMRFTRFAFCQRRQFRFRAVGVGVIGQNDIRAGSRHDVPKTLGRI